MNNFEKSSKIKKNKIFFAVKIAALLFCAAPLFISVLTGQSEIMFFSEITFSVIAVLLIILCIFFIRYVISKPNHSKLLDAFEILFFYAFCISSVLLSGGNTSYYKFIFIFIVIVYTIQLGMQSGIILSLLSALFMFITDFYGNTSADLKIFFYTDFCVSSMFFVIAFVIGFYVKMENEHIQSLEKFANIDTLTEVYNHRYFHEELERLCRESAKNHSPLSVMLLDIDFFQMYNSAYGYENGDKIIHCMASVLSERAHEDFVISRFGGDKFGMIMPGMTKDESIEFAERLRKFIENYHFDGEDVFPENKLTVSVGVADQAGSCDRPLQIIEKAEAALYRAKFLRKNRVEIYSSIFENFSDIDLRSRDRITLVKSLIAIVNSRDSYTYAHTERVLLYCQMFADYIKLDNDAKTKLVYGALLHDIGKVNVSKNALISDSKLTDEEWAEMKMHPMDGAQIIKQLGNLDDVAQIVLEHHEKYDGSGYPSGLKGEAINKLSRMLTLADCFDAMTSKRPYQRSRTIEEAFEELRRCKGTHFDPDLTEQFIFSVKNTNKKTDLKL